MKPEMKPDWRRLLIGTLIVVFVYLGFILSGLDLRVTNYFTSLPTERAQWLGASITVSLMSLSAALGFFLAKRKRRRSLAWLCTCFLLNVWGLIYLWSLPATNGQTRR
jgi:hypothetical protein